MYADQECFVVDNNYISTVLRQIKDKNAKKLIEQELAAHIDDKTEYFKELGYDEESARQMAVEAMGDPDDTAIPLASLHDVKWYKKLEIYLGLCFAVSVIIVLRFFPYNFSYAHSTSDIVHYVTVDFISFIFFVSAFLLIRLSRIKRNELLVSLVTVTQLIGSVTAAIFTPTAYCIAKLFSSEHYVDFSEYVHNVFSYSYPKYDGTTTVIITVLPILFTLILTLYGTAVLFKIYFDRHGKSNLKHTKILRIFETVTSCVLALVFIIMTAGTAVAVSNFDELKNENMNIRKQMADFVITLDTDGEDFDGCFEKLSVMCEENDIPLNTQSTDPSVGNVYIANKQNTIIMTVNDIGSGFSITYARTDFATPYLPMCKSMLMKESDFDKYVGKCTLTKDVSMLYSYVNNFSLSDAGNQYTLENFIDDGFYYNAACINKYDDMIYFTFMINDSDDFRSVDMVFADNILDEIRFYNYNEIRFYNYNTQE